MSAANPTLITASETALVTERQALTGVVLPPVSPDVAMGRELALTYPERFFRGSTLRGIEDLASSTRRAYLTDWIRFMRCCQLHGYHPLPASRGALETFIEWRTPYDETRAEQFHYLGKDAVREAVAAATLARSMAAIAAVHLAVDLVDPTSDPSVQKALSVHTKGRRASKSKKPLRWEAIESALQRLPGNDLRTLRNKALITVAHSTMLRRAELVRLTREQYERDTGRDFGRILVGVTKTSDGSVEAYRHVSQEAVRYLEAWLEAADIKEGYIFRSILPDGRFRTQPQNNGPAKPCHIEAGRVAKIFKQLAEVAGLEKSQIGGHSTRIGAAHDLKEFGAHTHDIMQDGGWKTASMVNRYTSGFNADEGSMARMARARRAKSNP